MTKKRYVNEVETVIHQDIVIGYRTRRRTIFDWGDMVLNESWYISHSIRNPLWLGNEGTPNDISGFKTRGEARRVLIANIGRDIDNREHGRRIRPEYEVVDIK